MMEALIAAYDVTGKGLLTFAMVSPTPCRRFRPFTSKILLGSSLIAFMALFRLDTTVLMPLYC